MVCVHSKGPFHSTLLLGVARGLPRPGAGGLRTSLDEPDRFRLARLPRLKLGRDGVLLAGVVGEPVGLAGIEDVEGRFACSASESKNSTKRFENDWRGPVSLLS